MTFTVTTHCLCHWWEEITDSPHYEEKSWFALVDESDNTVDIWGTTSSNMACAWRLGECSDVRENLMPVNVFLICYNCPHSQLMKAPHKLSLWRLFIGWPANEVYPQPLLQLSSHLIKASRPAQLPETARNWLSLWRAFKSSAYGKNS